MNAQNKHMRAYVVEKYSFETIILSGKCKLDKFALLLNELSFDKNPEQIYNDKIRFLQFSMRQGSQTHYTFTS